MEVHELIIEQKRILEQFYQQQRELVIEQGNKSKTQKRKSKSYKTLNSNK